VDAELVLDRDGRDGVAIAERAVGVDEVLRRDEQRQPLAPRGPGVRARTRWTMFRRRRGRHVMKIF
jgi:hypothetical protein